MTKKGRNEARGKGRDKAELRRYIDGDLGAPARKAGINAPPGGTGSPAGFVDGVWTDFIWSDIAQCYRPIEYVRVEEGGTMKMATTPTIQQAKPSKPAKPAWPPKRKLDLDD